MQDRIYRMFLRHRLWAWRMVFRLWRVLVIYPWAFVFFLWWGFSALPVLMLSVFVTAGLGLGPSAIAFAIVGSLTLHFLFLLPVYITAAKEAFTDYLAIGARMFGPDRLACARLKRAKALLLAEANAHG